MGVVYNLILIVFIILATGLILVGIWYVVPATNLQYNEFKSNVSYGLPETSNQFYQNMRYPDKKITYSLEPDCDSEKIRAILEAMAILEEKTILNFVQSKNGQIIFTCSELPPEPEKSAHFVAGEGGPTEVLNTSRYSLIIAGKVSLYRSEKCDKPIVATHEILHALGFDHESNKKSIMYPITDCSQEITSEIINDINNLYSVNLLPDLSIERLSGNTSKLYLNFDITVSNIGLKDIENSTLIISSEGKTIKVFPINQLNMGQKKILSVTNILFPRSVRTISFEITTPENEPEITLENNHANLEVKS
ncbi:hypothetical protein COU54_03115 [Candidatus Pacearchaeota archaeon CG10_big_fil_rev_8_21_14_0_10_31_24]|nr:MAG: hypothetical protein COU54_03115 [Candidatus Pacearchaeota archaeon CG10_big_fil_rev_8_21_14_0_10_31_24]